MTPFTLIVAATKDYGIGIRGGLPWRLPKDMAFFKHVTTLIPRTSPQHLQNVVIMGRVTWESIPEKFRPLADRFNIVISRNPNYDLKEAKDTVLADSLENALSLVQPEKHGRVFVIGGAEMYRLAIKKQCSHILMTRVHSNIECDTFFPAINEQQEDFHLADHQQLEEYVEQMVPRGKQSHKDIDYEFLLYIRK